MKPNTAVAAVMAAILIAPAGVLSAAEFADARQPQSGRGLTHSATPATTGFSHQRGPGVGGPSAADSQMLATDHPPSAAAARTLKKVPASKNCASGPGAGELVHLATVACHTQASATVACCRDTLGFGSRGVLRFGGLARSATSNGTHRTLRFFAEAMISGGEISENSQSRQDAAAAVNPFPREGSRPGEDLARDAPGLRLFTWSW